MTRLTDAEALELLRSRDLLGVGARAHEVRERLVPGDQATFVVDRNINFTNVCISGCRFCAFYAKPGAPEAYVLSQEAIHAKIQETLDLGGTAVMMQGGLHPGLDITYYEDLFRSITKSFPTITIHSLSAPEIMHIAMVSDLVVPEVLRRLKTAGLESLPGGGAEILVDRVRKQVAPGKADTATWLGVMREAHKQGIMGTATMMFGHIETLEERVEHLRRIRELQDQTGGFRAFIPWTFQPGHTGLEGDDPGSHGCGLPDHAGGIAPIPGQRAAHPGLVGDPGAQGGPGGPALRGRRPGQHHDRGERGGRRRGAHARESRRTDTRQPRGRVHAGAAADRLLAGIGGEPMPLQQDYVLRLIEQLGAMIRAALARFREKGPEERLELAGQAIGLALSMGPLMAANLTPASLTALLTLGEVDSRVMALLQQALDIEATAHEDRGDYATAMLRRDQAEAIRSLLEARLQSASGGAPSPSDVSYVP